jgi:hypothetical protein
MARKFSVLLKRLSSRLYLSFKSKWGSDDKSCELFHEQRQPSKDMQIRWIPKKCQDFLCTRGIIKKNMFIFSTRTFDVGVGSGGMEGNSIVS